MMSVYEFLKAIYLFFSWLTWNRILKCNVKLVGTYVSIHQKQIWKPKPHWKLRPCLGFLRFDYLPFFFFFGGGGGIKVFTLMYLWSPFFKSIFGNSRALLKYPSKEMPLHQSPFLYPFLIMALSYVVAYGWINNLETCYNITNGTKTKHVRKWHEFWSFIVCPGMRKSYNQGFDSIIRLLIVSSFPFWGERIYRFFDSS